MNLAIGVVIVAVFVFIGLVRSQSASAQSLEPTDRPRSVAIQLDDRKKTTKLIRTEEIAFIEPSPPGEANQDPPTIKNVVKAGNDIALVQHTGTGNVKFVTSEGTLLATYVVGDNLAVVKTPPGARSVAIQGGNAFDMNNARAVTQTTALAGVSVSNPDGGSSTVTNTGSSPLVAIYKGPSGTTAQIIAPGSSAKVPTGSQIVNASTGQAMLVIVAAAVPSPSSQEFNPPKPGSEPTPASTSKFVPAKTGFYFNSGDGSWDIRAITARGAAFGTSSIDLNVSSLASWRTLEDIQPNGTPDTCDHNFKPTDKNFIMGGGGIGIDIGPLRLSLDGFFGTWNAHGKLHTLCTEPGFGSGPVTTLDTTVPSSADGSLYGMNFAAYWPAFVYSTGNLEISIGPTAGFLWLVEVVNKVDGASRSGQASEFAGSVGGQISVRYFLSQKVALTVEGGVTYAFGDLNGLGQYGTIGVTFCP